MHILEISILRNKCFELKHILVLLISIQPDIHILSGVACVCVCVLTSLHGHIVVNVEIVKSVRLERTDLFEQLAVHETVGLRRRRCAEVAVSRLTGWLPGWMPG